MSPTEEVSPEEIAAVEMALKHIERQRGKKWALGLVAQWFLVLRMFKELEVAFTKSKSRQGSETKHRAFLTSLMGLGEILIAESESMAGEEFKGSGYTKECLQANVRYLREKYDQWFVPVDGATVDRVWKKLTDEREVNPGENLCPEATA